MSRHSQDVAHGERFEFGRNWHRFLDLLDDRRIQEAEESLRRMLEEPTLAGKRFLDIGSGSGLFSLAARRLGASVHSFDYDPESVACTRQVRHRYFPGDPDWQVEEGSALDPHYLEGLGTFDIVYSWGVLHHTGDMWRAMDLASRAVGPEGRLFIAIYNDMGAESERWHSVKKRYCSLPPFLRLPYALWVQIPREIQFILRTLLEGRPQRYVRAWLSYHNRRGMSRWHDIIDWIGGYPYEYATPDEVVDFYRARGFVLRKANATRGIGCNEFVLQPAKVGHSPDASSKIRRSYARTPNAARADTADAFCLSRNRRGTAPGMSAGSDSATDR